MMTVFILYEDGLHCDEDGLYCNEDGRRHSKAPKSVLAIRSRLLFFLIQAILRQFRFSGMSVFLSFTCQKNSIYPLSADFVFSVVSLTGLAA